MNELQITVGRIVLDGVEYEIGGTTVELDEEMAEYIRETLAEHGVEHNPENTVRGRGCGYATPPTGRRGVRLLAGSIAGA